MTTAPERRKRRRRSNGALLEARAIPGKPNTIWLTRRRDGFDEEVDIVEPMAAAEESEVFY